MHHYLFYLFFIISGSCLGDVIDINEPSGTEFTYRSTQQVSFIGYCSSGNFYLEPAMHLPDGFEFVGSHSFNITPDGSVYPNVYGGYPVITATGHQTGRNTIWPVNPRNPPKFLGLHWLCGSQNASGTYNISVPQEIKVQRMSSGNREIPPQIRLSLWYLNAYEGRQAIFRDFGYELVPPSMVSVGKIINESFMKLLAGERKEILRGEGKYSLVDICVSMDEKSWYWLEDRYKGKIINESCIKAENILPVSVAINERPPIGESSANIAFTVKIN